MAKHPHLVLTVHGIRTYGQWQSRLKAILEHAHPDITVLNYKYGFFSILAFILPFTRWLATRRFRHELLDVLDSKPWSRIDLVGHSFGTHLLGWAIHGAGKDKIPHIHTIILAGSVLKSSFPWNSLIGSSVKRLVNECGTKDCVLLLNQITVLFTGMAGRIGFYGLTGDSFQNRYYRFGHSDYFVRRGKLNDEFITLSWVPLLTSDGPIPEVDQREYPEGLRGALSGLGLWALNNAEPIKLAMWVTPFVLAFLYVLSLYNNAEQQRRATLSRQLAAEAGQIADQGSGQLESSTLMAIESLRLQETPEANATLRQNLALLPHILDTVHKDWGTGRVAFSPNDAFIAMTGEDYSVTVWKVGLTESPIQLAHGSDVTAMAFSTQKSWLATGTHDGTVQIWDLEAMWSAAVKTEARKIVTSHSVANLAFSHDGRTIAASTNDGRKDGTLVLWNLASKKPPIELSIEGPGSAVAFSPTDDLIAVGVDHYGARVFPVASHGKALGLQHPGITVLVAFSPSGLLGTASWGKEVKLWNMQTGKEVREFPHEGSVKALAFSPDGKWLATSASDGSSPGEVRVWSLGTGRDLARINRSEEINTLAFSPDSRFLASGSKDGTSSVWEVPAGRELSRHSPGYDSIVNVAFCQTKQCVFSGGEMSSWLWEFGTSEKAYSFDSGGSVQLTAFTPGDGRYLVWTTDEGPAFVWDREMGTPPRNIPSRSGAILALSGVQPLFAHTAFESGNTINIRNLATGDIVLQLKDIAHAEPRVWSSIAHAALSVDGTRMVVVTAQHQLTIWDVPEKRRVFQYEFEDEVSHIALSLNGDLLGVGNSNGNVTLYAIDDVKKIRRLRSINHGHPITGIAFSPDGTRVFTSSGDYYSHAGEVRISNVNGKQTITRQVYKGEVQLMLLSSNGRRLATLMPTGGRLSQRGEVAVLDATSGAKLATLSVNKYSPVAFSQNGEWVAGTAVTGEAVVWRVTSGRVVFRQSFVSRVTSVAFSPDDNLLAMGTKDGKMYATPWRWDYLRDAACKRITANFTCGEWKDQFIGEKKYHATCSELPAPSKCD